MRTGLLRGMMVSVLLAGLPAAFAGHDGVPDLVGTWEGSARVLGDNGFTSARTRLVVHEQQDGLFRGTYYWELDPARDQRGHAGEELALKGFENVLGVIEWDGHGFWVVDMGDTGMRRGHVVDADTLQTVYVESGAHAIVGRVTFRRAAEAAAEPAAE